MCAIRTMYDPTLLTRFTLAASCHSNKVSLLDSESGLDSAKRIYPIPGQRDRASLEAHNAEAARGTESYTWQAVIAVRDLSFFVHYGRCIRFWGIESHTTVIEGDVRCKLHG